MVEHPLSGGVAWNEPSAVAIGKGIDISFLFWLDDKVSPD